MREASRYTRSGSMSLLLPHREGESPHMACGPGEETDEDRRQAMRVGWKSDVLLIGLALVGIVALVLSGGLR